MERLWSGRRRWRARLAARLERWSAPRVIAVAVAMLVAVWCLDLASVPELSLSLLYLGPIALGTWYAGRVAGIALSGSAAVLWLTADGSVPDALHPFVPLWNLLVRIAVFWIVVELLVAQRLVLAREARLARTDSLTGLDNQRAFYEAAARELARAERYGHPISLIYLDLDDFKQVNDREGHSAGDELLRVVAATLRATLRGSDTAARLGGDEMALLLPETGEAEARALVDRLRKRLGEAMRQRGWPVTTSAGVVTRLRGGGTVDELIRGADELMYRVKESAKDDVAFARVE